MNINLGSNEELSELPMNENYPSMTAYLLKGEKIFPAVIICPGGAYSMRAFHEGEPVAKWFNSIGVSAFVLNYRVAPHRYPAALSDAKRAVRMVRHHAAEWNIDSSRIGILGFSAGGHLASTAGTHFDHGNSLAEDPIEWMSSRPDCLILCYPVITMGPYTHEGSKENLLGKEPSLDLVHDLSSEKQVTKETPPTFIWHTADDEAVAVENSLLFAQELSRKKVPYALHVFENGAHGLGLAEGTQGTKEWPNLCEAWLIARRFI